MLKAAFSQQCDTGRALTSAGTARPRSRGCSPSPTATALLGEIWFSSFLYLFHGAGRGELHVKAPPQPRTPGIPSPSLADMCPGQVMAFTDGSGGMRVSCRHPTGCDPFLLPFHTPINPDHLQFIPFTALDQCSNSSV